MRHDNEVQKQQTIGTWNKFRTIPRLLFALQAFAAVILIICWMIESLFHCQTKQKNSPLDENCFWRPDSYTVTNDSGTSTFDGPRAVDWLPCIVMFGLMATIQIFGIGLLGGMVGNGMTFYQDGQIQTRGIEQHHQHERKLDNNVFGIIHPEASQELEFYTDEMEREQNRMYFMRQAFAVFALFIQQFLAFLVFGSGTPFGESSKDLRNQLYEQAQYFLLAVVVCLVFFATPQGDWLKSKFDLDDCDFFG